GWGRTAMNYPNSVLLEKTVLVMVDATITEVIPIYTDEDGRMRVSGTRVLLDLIVDAYRRGETPEHMVQMYPTLTLDQVYLAIGYYLRHRETVDDYIRRMDEEAERLRREWEAEHPPKITQAELLARRQAKRDNTG
ncbi:MAG: DUF433 domain-containing protein, partial [Anaerolineae bacterium]|nr:DUF433 domain-containing protein [Anaerolineae bacterium]